MLWSASQKCPSAKALQTTTFGVALDVRLWTRLPRRYSLCISRMVTYNIIIILLAIDEEEEGGYRIYDTDFPRSRDALPWTPSKGRVGLTPKARQSAQK
jgi:hypothetical protein